MREIKFRGKLVGSRVWVYGNYEYFHADEYCNAEYYVDGSDVIPETVGQYTGLTDKNGKEIYEGDILKDKFYGGYTVDYCADWGAFRAKKIYEYDDGEKFFLIAGSQSFIGNEWREWEVIGNIHDNPELLKEETK